MPEKTNDLPKSLKLAEGKIAGSNDTDLQRRKTVVIGRGAGCDVVLKDVKASRKHCRLTRAEGSFQLEDLGSKNGTFVDGQKINAPILLKVNQTFKVGDTVFYLAS